jgi:hypothetical protein
MLLSHPLRLRAALIALLATAIAGVAVFSATASADTDAPTLPDRIQVTEEGHKPFLLAHAVGVQIYACSPTADGPKWRLVAPRADLYGEGGKLIATHFGGPTWQAKDGSSVRGQREAGVTVDETAIQWLRLKADTPTAGPDGDRLKPTTYIQRIATTGGLPPDAAGCNAATAGTVNEVPYTADYYFWKANGS